MTLDVYAGLFEDGLDDVADRMDTLARNASDSLRTSGQIVALPDRENGAGKPLSSGDTKWGSRGLNPGPTDYENDRNPHGTPTIRRFVLGCLTLADPADQGFSLLCAINVP